MLLGNALKVLYIQQRLTLTFIPSLLMWWVGVFSVVTLNLTTKKQQN